MHRLGLALALALFSAPALAPIAQAEPAAEAASPAPTEGLVLRPTFEVEGNRYPAGTAFVVAFEGHTLVLTAHHLLGPPGGMPKIVTAADVPSTILGVALKDAWTGTRLGRAARPLLIADAKPMTEDPAADIAVFRAEARNSLDIGARTTASLKPARFADTAPKVGDAVWLAAALVSGDKDKRLHPAKVVQVEANGVYVKYEETALDLTGTAGAPLVNAAGDVVGMALGGGVMDGELIGLANPLPAIKKRVEAGLARAASQEAPAEAAAPTEGDAP
jgi:hypothetical protein